jgi:hypothetical protein
MAKRQAGKGRVADTQGPKTHRRFIQQLHSVPHEPAKANGHAREQSRPASRSGRRSADEHDRGEHMRPRLPGRP